ncbi:ABC transporter transmembrane domain-containing protein [Nitrosomonas sp. ANs5]|uniref:ABC transporter transmembrane domain-containing protein n=1 Tax=Nitrosomonas sp. ANs5 TaxID=3423941 RepID=UPI003D349BCF
MSFKPLTIEIVPLRRFLAWSAPYWTSLIPTVLAGSLIALVVSCIPFVTSQLFIHALPGGNKQLLQELPVLLTVLLIAAVLANLAGHHTLCRICNRLALELRMQLFDKLLALRHARYDFSTTTISARFFTDMEKLCHLANRLGTNLSRDLLILIGLFAVMIYLNGEMAVLVFAMLVALYLVIQMSRGSAHHHGTRSQTWTDLSRVIHKTIQHFRTIHLDQSNQQESQHMRSLFKHYQDDTMAQARQVRIVGLLAMVLLIGMLTAFLYYLIQQLTLDKLALDDAAAFLIAMLLLVFPLLRLIDLRSTVAECSQLLRSLFSLLDQQSGVIPESSPLLPANRPIRGELKVEAIGFRNSGQLKTLPSLSIKPGKKIGLIDSDNQVKRLLADLVCGFIRPESGKIMLDNQAIGRMSRTNLYAHIAWVTPDKILLTDTMAANIAYGAMRCSTEAAITAAAQASQASEFIREMPHGLQTKVDHPAVQLSDHQRQRILIARALLKNPSIVILDETRAYFDMSSLTLRAGMAILLENRTALILSSRPAMLAFADHAYRINPNG